MSTVLTQERFTTEPQKQEQNPTESLLKQILSQLQAAPKGLDKLAAAYVEAWAELDKVVRNAENPHARSTYADLSAVLSVIKPVFAKHKLALFQAPGKLSAEGDRVALPGVLFHASGQYLEIVSEMPCRPIGKKGESTPIATAQSVGSAITYGRRYQAQAVAGIAPVDDDGNEASGRAESEPAPTSTKADVLSAVAGMTPDTEAGVKKAVEELGDDEVVKAFLAKRREFKRSKRD